MISITKGLGYFVSTISVLLLGIVAWQGATGDPLLRACLVAGMGLSVLGMAFRWISHRQDRREKEREARNMLPADLPDVRPAAGAAAQPLREPPLANGARSGY